MIQLYAVRMNKIIKARSPETDPKKLELESVSVMCIPIFLEEKSAPKIRVDESFFYPHTKSKSVFFANSSFGCRNTPPDIPFFSADKKTSPFMNFRV